MKALYENHYLTDTDVANFARQSFAELAKHYSPEQNNNLIRFLARGMKTQDWNSMLDRIVSIGSRAEANELATYLRKIPCHWVPFGHPHISLRMQAPVPIARQAFKHKIGYVESEESRRYIKSTPEFFVPNHFRSAAEDVKQGSGGIHPQSAVWKACYVEHVSVGIDLYLSMIEDGVCPEQARLILAQGVEVNWVWTGSLYAYAMAYNARSDSHAQQEIQDLFAEVNEIIAPLFPVSWAALTGGDV